MLHALWVELGYRKCVTYFILFFAYKEINLRHKFTRLTNRKYVMMSLIILPFQLDLYCLLVFFCISLYFFLNHGKHFVLPCY